MSAKSLTGVQKSVIRTDVSKAINRICDVWPDANEAAAMRGYPSGGGDGRSGVGSHADPVANVSLRADVASEWLRRARPPLVLLLTVSAQDHGSAFNPPAMRKVFVDASVVWIDLWPKNTMRLFQRIYDLANQGAAEWPATPRKGAKVGDVVVGQRPSIGEICQGCSAPVYGGAGDPIGRIDGKPYHKSTCYWRARRAVPAKVTS